MRRREGPDYRILEIIPAPGWRAAFVDTEYEPEGDGETLVEAIAKLEAESALETVPLACWALVLKGGEQYVAGMGSGREPEVGMLDDGSEHFLGYIAPGDDIEIWEKLARDTWNKIETKRKKGRRR